MPIRIETCSIDPNPDDIIEHLVYVLSQDQITKFRYKHYKDVNDVEYIQEAIVNLDKSAYWSFAVDKVRGDVFIGDEDLVICFDKDLNKKWETTLGSSGHITDMATVDNGGGIYVAKRYDGTHHVDSSGNASKVNDNGRVIFVYADKSGNYYELLLPQV